jgi:hypothetical protein
VFRANGGDVLVNAHDHHYERFSADTWGNGSTDNPPAVRQYVVGTGGAIQSGLSSASAGLSQYAVTGKYGVLLLKLRSNGYDSAFHWIDEANSTGEEDSQTGLSCR